jgi:RNA 3'-terminal phosphate cyclase (ATP)
LTEEILSANSVPAGGSESAGRGGHRQKKTHDVTMNPGLQQKMIQVDGAHGSGSGTIVRFATALAALLKRPLHLCNARAKREKPGLRAQHLAAVRACAELCDAKTEGLAIGSREFTFVPSARIRGGSFAWDIGTAGSATMFALGILPLACFAEAPLTARITGGVFQDFAPSAHHMQQYVLAPLLARMGVDVELRVVRAGYVPRGSGVIELCVRPARDGLTPLFLTEQGAVRDVSGIALSSHLEERHVSDRMGLACEAQLALAGLRCKIERVCDSFALHAGASLAVWATTSTGCILGADRAGALRRSSETIGRFVAKALLEDVATGATTDRHAADQLVLFAALAGGTTCYVPPALTDHLETNLWLAGQFGARICREDRRLAIEGLGLQR